MSPIPAPSIAPATLPAPSVALPAPTEPPGPDGAPLLARLAEIEGASGYVLGVHVYDLVRDADVADLHPGTVFSGASVVKIAIMLYAYAQLPSFTHVQEEWLRAMIVESNNVAANELLAAGAGGATPNDAARGSLEMSALLADLGLQHTYLRGVYADESYGLDFSGLYIPAGAAQEGEPPFTTADPYLRATPREMGRILLWIERCRQGAGPLPARFPATLTPTRCQEMLDRLSLNGDRSRLVAGVPDGVRVEHKSGWIQDTQGDAGIVRSPGGDYLLSVFVYRDVGAFDAGAATATIVEVSRTVYEAFNR